MVEPPTDGAQAPVVDLNADVGEAAAGPAGDLELLAFVTSINVACGGHAGDVETMASLCLSAAESGVAVGAHPGYPDRERFGRHETGASPSAIEQEVADQVGLLASIARANGVEVGHVKPHGALYHRCWSDPAAAKAVVSAAAGVLPGCSILAPPGSELESASRRAGLGAVPEGFADRAYDDGGSLVPRSRRGALLGPEEAIDQALALALGGALAGGAVRSLCLHGDGERSVEIARAVAGALQAAGVALRGFR